MIMKGVGIENQYIVDACEGLSESAQGIRARQGL